MKIYKHFIFMLCLSAGLTTQAQQNKAMTFEEMVEWERITSQSISENGKWVTCKMEPWQGDATVFLYNDKGQEKARFSPASNGEFTSPSTYLLVTNTPAFEEVQELKLKKTPKKKMPMNSLTIYNLSGGEERIDSIRSYKASKTADWMAYQRGTAKDSALIVRSMDGARQDTFPKVTGFDYAKKGNVLYFVSDSTLYTYTPENGSRLISDTKAGYKKMAFDEKGDKLAYLLCTGKDSTAIVSSLYLSTNQQPGQMVAENGNIAFPDSWIINQHSALSFSENGERLFFGTSPEPLKKDTTVLAADRPDVQVWSWDEGIQYTVQTVNKAADLKRSYMAVYNINSGNLVQLADKELPNIQLADKGNAAVALLSTTAPYDTQRMWRGRNYYDIYTVNLESGERKEIAKANPSNMSFSPKGNYTSWYSAQDSVWYTYSIAENQKYQLTSPTTFPAWNDENDVPDYPNPYGIAGWTTNDEALLIRDKYDIWKFSPTGATAPINITVNGRTEQITYSLLRLDPEERAFNPAVAQYLTGFNQATKATGYYQGRINKPTKPNTLLAGDFRVAGLTKAKQSDAVIYTQESYEEYPDIRLSNLSFKKSLKLTDGGAQQDGILWGTAELTSWISLDGTPLEGVIYKPTDFDPNKKYPMIVNFYERNSNTLYNYHMVGPGRSTIDYAFYISQGFIIFNPDVRYTDGYPGESCYNCVMPGITSILEKGYIDEKRIGAQGHSWGGYQVAYLATRTNLFAAIESGAPVVNMLSAYGGIRWGTGLNRAFQYEHGQSRIGGSIWESPMLYIENSPLFNMNKVNTPILIMHNDKDGHVPWYQGIEYFIALKRLQKPCWLLNYVNEPHWASTLPNRIDFQKRMFQFFSHYLQDAPMPKWMEEGVKAVDKDFELGY